MANSKAVGAEGRVASRRDIGGLTSVDNALLLIKLVSERQALRVAEAAVQLGVARSTAHRLLAALRQQDFVVQDRPNGAYRPGPALHEIGMKAISRIDIRRIARPFLDELRERTTETASLATLEGTNVRFVDCAESPRSVRVGNRTGIIRQAHAAAVGKALLAELSEEEIRRRYAHGLEPGTSATLTKLADLLAELREVRAQGYALNWGETAEGVSAVGVALRDATGAPIASIGIAAPASRTGGLEGIRALAPEVVRVAAQVQEKLDHPD
jgi:IclR family transcriptional regulator, acetate operon repressor